MNDPNLEIGLRRFAAAAAEQSAKCVCVRVCVRVCVCVCVCRWEVVSVSSVREN